MKTLYIIGNGFDLWHGLPTSYSHFSDFAGSLLSEIEWHYSFAFHQDNPWHDFENALGAYDPELFFSYHNGVDISADDFRPRDIYGLEDGLEEQTDAHVSSICDAFVEWVNQIDISQAILKTIFPENSIFLSFNYTSTLQSVYGIHTDRVLHIHGQVGTHDEIIFGHGEEIREIPEFDEYGEPKWDMYSDARNKARYPLYALKKQVDGVLVRHEQYFQQLSDVTEIIVIGHSLNKIDHPYFSRINQSAPDAIWKICCYSVDDEESLRNNLIACGVSTDRISTFGYDCF